MKKDVYTDKLNEDGNLQIKKTYFDSLTNLIEEKEEKLLTIRVKRDINDLLTKSDWSDDNLPNIIQEQYKK